MFKIQDVVSKDFRIRCMAEELSFELSFMLDYETDLGYFCIFISLVIRCLRNGRNSFKFIECLFGVSIPV